MRSSQTQTQLLFSCSEILPSCQQTKSHPFVLWRYCELMRVSNCIVYIQREKCYIFKINGDHLLSWCIVLTNSAVREAPESQSGNFVGQDTTISFGCFCVVWQLLLLIWLSGPAGVSVFTQLASKDLHLSSHDLYSTDSFFFSCILFIEQWGQDGIRKAWPYFHVGSRLIKFCISLPS